MQTRWKIILCGFLPVLFGGLYGCVPGSMSAAPIETIHHFGEVNPVTTAEPSSDTSVTAEPVDDEDQEMQKALVVKRNWTYQKPEAQPVKAAAPAAPVPPPKMAVHSVVNGTLLSDEDGVVSIQTAAGAPVHSVVNGTLIYTGPSVQGGGKMVIVKNSAGTLFAYSHLKTVSVSEGATVQAKEVLGVASEEPLVFQVRQSSGTVDAKPYLN